MRPLHRFVRRIRRLLGWRRAEAEMADEMRFHLEHRAADYAADGLPAEDAGAAAHRKFGNLGLLQERARDAHRWTGLEGVLRDLRFALRHCGKFPGFTAVAVLTLAIGIGANTAMFSLVNAMVLRPLPYPHAEHLRQLWTRNAAIGTYPVANGLSLRQWQQHATTVDVAAISDRAAMNLIEHGTAESVNGAAVSTNYLDVLGVRAWRGRTFGMGDDVPGPASQVVILTHEWWQHRFGGDRSILHRTITLHLRPYTVIGILPPRALAQDYVNFLVPLSLDDEGGWRLRAANLTPIVRLRPGVTAVEATRELEALTRELEARDPPAFPTTGHELSPLHLLLVGPAPPPYALLLGAVGIVLLIVSVNLATLLLARGTVRQKEMAVRAALGASAGRILRQMLTESIVLAVGGGVLGIAGAFLGVEVLGHWLTGDLPAVVQPDIDGRVLIFTLLVTIGTSIHFGLLPALQARRVNVQRHLKDEGHGSTSAGRSRILAGLVVAELALTVMLLVGAGLLGRSFLRLLRTDPGFDAAHVLTCDVALTPGTLADENAAVQFQWNVVAALREVPGVIAAGTTTTLPLRNERWGTNIRSSAASDRDFHLAVGSDYVGGDYFAAMGMTLRRGRWITASDQVAGAPRVVVVTESCADALWPGENPLGFRIHFNDADWEIVGVANDVRYLSLDETPPPRVYAAHAFTPWTMRLVVRTAVAPLSLAATVRRTVAGVDATHSVSNFRSLDQAVDQSLQRRQGALGLLGAFAMLALLLAAMGLYGVIAYTIAQARREFAIRIALGAERRTIFGLMLRRGLRLTLGGLALGLLGAFLGSRLIAGYLYAIDPLDPLVFLLAPLVIAVTALGAAALPALRATRTDVLQVLRAP